MFFIGFSCPRGALESILGALGGNLGALGPSWKHLGGYDSALRGILTALGAILSAIRSPKEGPTPSGGTARPRAQATERGGERIINLSQELGLEGLDSKKTTPNLYTP